MQLSHLRGRKIVDRVRSKGARFRGKHMNITYVMGMPRTTMGKNLSTHSSFDGRYASAQDSFAPTSVGRQGKHFFVGTTASTKLDKSAVRRNRMRRRCREALRLTAKERQKLPVCQLLISPRSSSLDCAFQELQRDAVEFLTSLEKTHIHRS
ncbi:MAG TPA: ribonuclease P protein component [Candidatus Peribacterales bacterium]|nr:ribonuclease P protein component [Candidatus Peribacterales bacterium]